METERHLREINVVVDVFVVGVVVVVVVVVAVVVTCWRGRSALAFRDVESSS